MFNKNYQEAYDLGQKMMRKFPSTSREFKKGMAICEWAIKKDNLYKTEPSECYHQCSGNCRRVGCNCECGEFHEYVGSMEEKMAAQGLEVAMESANAHQ